LTIQPSAYRSDFFDVWVYGYWFLILGIPSEVRWYYGGVVLTFDGSAYGIMSVQLDD